MAERAVAPAPSDQISTIVENLGRVIHAPDETLRLVVLCLVAEGHAIIEDFPGVGKTMLAKALARSLDCNFSRLQFTPDLLPSDVTGVNVFNQRENEFEFRPGPVFAHLILVGDVRLDAELPFRTRREVHADDPCALLREEPRRLGADAAGRAGDDAHLSLEPSGH